MITGSPIIVLITQQIFLNFNKRVQCVWLNDWALFPWLLIPAVCLVNNVLGPFICLKVFSHTLLLLIIFALLFGFRGPLVLKSG